MMTVELSLAQAGKVFAAPEDPGGPQPRQKLPCIGNRLAGIRRHRPRTHHCARCLERQVEHRREVNIKSECAAVLADNLAVLAKKLAIIEREHIRRRRRRSQRIAKPVDSSALKINTSEQRRANASLTFAQQLPGLLGALNIPR